MCDSSFDQIMDLQGMEAALRRAARHARRIAAETNTPVVYVKDGQIVEEWVTMEDIKREESYGDGLKD